MKKTRVLLLLPLLTACAVTAPPQQAIEAPVSRAQQVEAQKQAALPSVKTFKRKIAIGRFSNETRYGRTFQVDADQDPLGKQASDMLMNRLVGSRIEIPSLFIWKGILEATGTLRKAKA